MAHYDKKATNSYALGTQATFYLLEARPDLALRIYISPKQTRDATYDKLVEKARSLHLPVIENNAKIFKELSDKDNVMAIGEFRKFEGRLETKNNHLVLVNPSNMGNLGTILRTAVGFGIHDVAIIGVSADAFDPKVVRASMGAIFFLNLAFFPDFESYRSVYPNHFNYPFMLQAKTMLSDAEIQAPWSLIFGNEAKGLDASFLEVGTPLLIPLTNNVDSLNLDNAVAIGVYAFTQQAKGK